MNPRFDPWFRHHVQHHANEAHEDEHLLAMQEVGGSRPLIRSTPPQLSWRLNALLAEWLSTGLLIRGGRFDPFAAHIKALYPNWKRTPVESRCGAGSTLEGSTKHQAH